MRAQVYYNAPAVEDMGKARDYCLQVLERQNPAADSVQKLKTLSLLVNRRATRRARAVPQKPSSRRRPPGSLSTRRIC